MDKFEANSDIDLAIIGECELLVISKIKTSLNDLPVPYKFDVVHYDTIDNSDLKKSYRQSWKKYCD